MTKPIDQLVAAASDLTIDYIKKTIELAKYRPVNEYDVAYNDGIKTAIRLIEVLQMEMKLKQSETNE